MISQYDVYKILNTNEKLISKMDKIRGKQLSESAIYVGTPDQNFITEKNAPWIRISTIPGDEADYADDKRIMEYPRFQIDFWVKKIKGKEALELENIVYEAMRSSGFERYYRKDFEDGDMNTLQMFQNNFQFQGLF